MLTARMPLPVERPDIADAVRLLRPALVSFLKTMNPTAERDIKFSTSAPENAQSSKFIAIAICCLAIILALAVGVGLASNLVLRHIVQTLPLWLGVAFGFRRSRATGWTALPSFLFWLVLMIVIWLYLLGIAHVISGHFSPVEIAMTIIVGTASAAGIAMFARLKSGLSAMKAASIFAVLLLVQWVCFRLSFLPAIAHR